jgi:hypothetical protein
MQLHACWFALFPHTGVPFPATFIPIFIASHCHLPQVFTIYVDSVSAQDDSSVRWGKISFVDLAGSERLKESKSTGEMARETGAINRSLFALGKVACFVAMCLMIHVTRHTPPTGHQCS